MPCRRLHGMLAAGTVLFCFCAGGSFPAARAADAPEAAPASSAAAARPAPVPSPFPSGPSSSSARPLLILVQGAAGDADYGRKFTTQMEAWKQLAARAEAEVISPSLPVPAAPAGPDGGPVPPPPAPSPEGTGTGAGSGSGTAAPPAPAETVRTRLEKILTTLDPDPAAGPVWLVMLGHGTFDGTTARFNLEGPDISPAELASWLAPVKRPLNVILASSSSAPFLPALAGPDRVVITATRSGNEKNYSRFGDSMAAALTDPEADLDQDGQTSLLELFLAAARRTDTFYLEEGRIQTEHALMDDNGDGKGTPAAWFRGLRAISQARDNTPVDGQLAQLRTFIPDPGDLLLTPEQITRRDALENSLHQLRSRKASLREETYYAELGTLLDELAALYAAGNSSPPVTPAPPVPAPPDHPPSDSAALPVSGQEPGR